MDVEGPQLVAQVKHVQVLSRAALEALATEIEAIGLERRKLGVVCVKRRAGRGCPTPGLVVMTERVWGQLVGMWSTGEQMWRIRGSREAMCIRLEKERNMERLLTVKQVADLLVCSEAGIRKWIYQGKLPVVKVGRLTRVRVTDLEAFARAGR